ncbi:MAG: hypothetical protein WCG03_08515 [Kiritimatiellales bacterium]
MRSERAHTDGGWGVKSGQTMPAKDDNPHSLESFFCLGASGEWNAKKKDIGGFKNALP